MLSKRVLGSLKHRSVRIYKKFLSARVKVSQANSKLKQQTSLKGSYISPEIFKDEFSSIVEEICSLSEIKYLIEIGSSSGEGSTASILKGTKQNASKCYIHLIEIDEYRCSLLHKRLKGVENINVHNGSSIPIHQFPTWDDISEFYLTNSTNFNKYPLSTIKKWYEADKIALTNLPSHKADLINQIKNRLGAELFDFVLIDGGEFTGKAELNLLWGAKFIALDDINSFKCYDSYWLLRNSPDYFIFAENWKLRNGFAIFQRRP